MGIGTFDVFFTWVARKLQALPFPVIFFLKIQADRARDSGVYDERSDFDN